MNSIVSNSFQFFSKTITTHYLHLLHYLHLRHLLLFLHLLHQLAPKDSLSHYHWEKKRSYRPHPQPLPLKGGETMRLVSAEPPQLSPPFKGRGWGWGLYYFSSKCRSGVPLPHHHGKASQKKISREIFFWEASVFFCGAPPRKNEYLFFSCRITIPFLHRPGATGASSAGTLSNMQKISWDFRGTRYEVREYLAGRILHSIVISYLAPRTSYLDSYQVII